MEAISAKIYGEPLLRIPKGLYIPPEALEVYLEAFEGPLDLLLHLIRRQNLNILDIQMTELTKQYVRYVELMRETSLELAADYLLMAALLINIKSSMLLPRHKATEEDELDPRADLVRRLVEYERIKLVAQRLGALPQNGYDFWLGQATLATEEGDDDALPTLAIADLASAWRVLSSRVILFRPQVVQREELSVQHFMVLIVSQLQATTSGAWVSFDRLFPADAEARVRVVHFLASLELCRESLIELTQNELFSPMYMRLSLKKGMMTEGSNHPAS